MKLLSHLSRITTAGRVFLPQIDGLRFVAIIGVIAFHVRQICSFHLGVSLDQGIGAVGFTNRLFEAGANGVQLFFAISGFILALPFAKHYLLGGPVVSLRGYFLRRLTRLEPPYIIHLGILFLLSILVFRNLPAHGHLYHNPDWVSYLLKHLSASLFYANGFIFGTHPYPNIVLWSLEIEVQFYIMAPLLALLFKIPRQFHRRAVLALLIGANSLLVYSLHPLDYRIGSSLLGNLQFFLVGFLVCDFYLVEWMKADVQNWKWDLIFLIAGLGIVFLHRTSVSVLCLPWLILLCVVAAFKGGVSRRVLSYPWVAVIGGMCYTIYMYHSLLISLVIRVTKKFQTQMFTLDLWVQLVVMSVLVIAVSMVLFFFFERPFMRKDWPMRVWSSLVFQKRRSS